MRRRAFTLTELLVVVVIIGVLSAVVLPKFSKVIETRKTTEAEELMAAVRTEQEARCTLSRSYTDQTSKLGSYKAGKNYDYSLGTVGMTASAKSGKYALEMPSYADGRICCSDIESGSCSNLNKNYPLCSELINQTDYTAGNEDCGVAKIEDPCANGGCEPGPGSCDGSHSEGASFTKPCACGVAQYKWTCVNGNWEEREVAGCEAMPSGKKTCEPCGEQVAGTPNCTAEGKWELVYPACKTVSECPGKCQDGETKSAGQTGDGCADIQVTCKNGEWDYSSLSYQLKEGSECYSGQTNNGMSCNQCHWSKCPGNKVEIDGVCCLPGQKVKNGKCLYKYRPNRFNTGILVVCHSSSYNLTMPENAYVSEAEFNSGYQGLNQRYSSYTEYVEAVKRSYQGTQGYYGGPMAKNPGSCSVMGYSYYRGGSIPYVNEGSGCDWHYAHNPWWNGGTRIQGNNVYGTDQDWCDNNCGSQASCDKKGIIPQSGLPSSCGTYHCSNGWHCDNAPGGNGQALECIREE